MKFFKIKSKSVYTSADDISYTLYNPVGGYYVEFYLLIHKSVGYLFFIPKARPTGAYQYLNIHLNLKTYAPIYQVRRIAVANDTIFTVRVGSMTDLGYAYTTATDYVLNIFNNLAVKANIANDISYSYIPLIFSVDREDKLLETTNFNTTLNTSNTDTTGVDGNGTPTTVSLKSENLQTKGSTNNQNINFVETLRVNNGTYGIAAGQVFQYYVYYNIAGATDANKFNFIGTDASTDYLTRQLHLIGVPQEVYVAADKLSYDSSIYFSVNNGFKSYNNGNNYTMGPPPNTTLYQPTVIPMIHHGDNPESKIAVRYKINNTTTSTADRKSVV